MVKEIRRSKPWGSYWLERYDKEGIKGLRDKPRSGRIPQISLSISTRIRKTLREKQTDMDDGLPDKQMILYSERIRNNTLSLYTYVYRLLHRWGFKQKVSTEKGR